MAESDRFQLRELLLAEAVRLHEEAAGFVRDEPQADAAGRAAGGTLDRRIVARAQALSLAPGLQTALASLREATTLALAGAVLLATAAGAGAAQAVLGVWDGESVNFFRALVGLLGLPTLTLLLWAALMLTRPAGAAAGALGRLVLAAGSRLARRLHDGPHAAGVVGAAARVFSGSTVGRWTVSAISHGLWAAYLGGALAVLLLLLSTREFTFAWETTILSEHSYVVATRVLSVLPDALGFATPRAEDVAATRSMLDAAAAEAARQRWAGLLIGSVLAYGLLPRAVLLLLSATAAWRAVRRYRLDVAHPGYAGLRARLLPVAESGGVVDPDHFGVTSSTPAGRILQPPAAAAVGSEGRFAVLGLEIEPPASGWPPPVQGIDWIDLGFVDDRTSRNRVCARLRDRTAPLRALVTVCSLAQSPDRGMCMLLQSLQQAAGAPLLLLLTFGQRLRARGEHELLQHRVRHWRELATAAGLPDDRIIETDLDHLTVASREQLGRWLGTGTGAPAASSPEIAAAFALILAEVKRWHGPPEAITQAELHRAIARLYQSHGTRWQQILGLRASDSALSVSARLRGGAEGMLVLLPARLKTSAPWLAAGAVAGALGCVAAATLVAPAALAALPAWAGLGAAVSGATRWALGSNDRNAAPDDASPPDLAQAVAAAALFAVTLHLQGRSETTITTLLDQVFREDTVPAITGEADAERWLDTLQQRLHAALDAADGVPR